MPRDPKRRLSGESTTALGPIYDPDEDKMLGGIINTYRTLAFAETTFGLLRSEQHHGPVSELNKRSIRNRKAINDWVAKHDLFELGVAETDRRGAAVTLLKVVDPATCRRGSCMPPSSPNQNRLLGYEGLTHPNGDYEPGLDVARYVNAFPARPVIIAPGSAASGRWTTSTALLDNLEYAYHRAKIVVLEEDSSPSFGEHLRGGRPEQPTAVRKDNPRPGLQGAGGGSGRAQV